MDHPQLQNIGVLHSPGEHPWSPEYSGPPNSHIVREPSMATTIPLAGMFTERPNWDNINILHRCVKSTYFSVWLSTSLIWAI